MNTKTPQDDNVQEDPSLDSLLAQAVETVKQLDVAIHEELRDKPERLAEWEAIMREYADVLAEHEREQEEKRLSDEIGTRMNQVSADIDRLTTLDPVDLEFDELLGRTFASIREVDAIVQDIAHKYPAKVAEWEEVLEVYKEMEALHAANMKAKEAEPGN